MEIQAARALEIYRETRAAGQNPSPSQIIAALKACSSLNQVEIGRKIHAQLQESSGSAMIHRNICVATTLMDMYAKCGSLVEAREIFESMRCRSAVSWNCIILGCAHCGDFEQALELYSRMKNKACMSPNHVTFLAVLKACIGLVDEGRDKCLERIRMIHREAARSMVSGIHTFVANSLITAYSKCGRMEEALKVFQGMRERSIVSWTEMIMGYAANGEEGIALEFYDRMLEQGFSPSHVTLLAALKACSGVAENGAHLECVAKGKTVHARAVRDGFDSQVIVASSLVDMYARCGRLVDALAIFENMPNPTVVSWNCIVLGNVLGGKAEHALELYRQMQDQGYRSDAATFVAALKACMVLAEKEGGKFLDGKLMKTKSLALGKSIHFQAVAAAGSSNGELHIFVANGLIDMYSKCGSMVDALDAFESIRVRSLVSWNCIIFGLAETGNGKQALQLYQQMQEEGWTPNHVTYLAALKACVALIEKEEAENLKMVMLQCLETVKDIYAKAKGDLQHRFLANAIVGAYAKCGSLESARKMFNSLVDKDVVTWNSMIMGYAENGDGKAALELYKQMHEEGYGPDELTFVAVLKACGSLINSGNKNLQLDLREEVRHIHLRAAAGSRGLNVFVANSLIDFYMKCGLIADALRVFESTQHRSVVSWNCMILGLADNGFHQHALTMYSRMRDDGFFPDIVTFIATLKACGSLGDIETGRKIRLEIISAGLDKDATLANSLIDFYGKCGSMDSALVVFNSLRRKSAVSWNTLIDGYSRQGSCQNVLRLFNNMKEQRCQPDETTFLLVLNVCCHGGLVDEGNAVFESMTNVYGISPGLKHYNCMVDLFGRANRLDEALEIVNSMKMEPSCVIWMTLLGACWKWKNVTIGEIAFKSITTVSTKDWDKIQGSFSAACVMMSNIYASTGRVQDWAS